MSGGYQSFFMLNSIENEIYHAHYVKMPQIDEILTYISMINTISKNSLNFLALLSFYEQLEFHAKVSLA